MFEKNIAFIRLLCGKRCEINHTSWFNKILITRPKNVHTVQNSWTEWSLQNCIYFDYLERVNKKNDLSVVEERIISTIISLK